MEQQMQNDDIFMPTQPQTQVPQKKEMGRVGSFFFSLLPMLTFFGIQIVAMVLVMIPIMVVEMTQTSLDLSNSTGLAQFYAAVVQKVTPPATGLAHLMGAVLFALWYRLSFRKPRPTMRDTVKRLSPEPILLALAMGILMCIYSNGIVSAETLLFPEMVESALEKLEMAGVGNHPFVIFATVILAPIGEELVFRGLTMKYAERAFQRFWAANLFQAFLFGLMHMNWVQGVYAFAGGLVLGWLAHRYHSIIPSMVMHFVVNTASTIGLGVLLSNIPMNWLSTVLLIVLPAGVTAGLIYWKRERQCS